MSITNKDLKRRILDISFSNKLSHLGSCLTAVDIIEEIYQKKKPGEKFVLSAGHAGLALYVVLEKHFGHNAEELFLKHGVHPNRDPENHIDYSAGSLGHGIGGAVGMALADKSKNVYCLITDGELAEGSVWEALRVAEKYQATNLIVYANLNGWGAYDRIRTGQLELDLRRFPNLGEKTIWHTSVYHPLWPKWLMGQLAHYKVMTEEEYKQALEILDA